MSEGGPARLLGLLPVVAVLALLFGGALLLAVAQALGHAPWIGIRDFPDIRPFAELWSSRAFWASLGLTLYYAAAATVLSLVLGTALALILLRAFRGRALFRYVYKLPLMVPYTVGIALAVVMLGNGGMLSRVAAATGLIDDPGDFPRILGTHWGWGIVAVYVWKQVPFVTLAIHAVLLGVGRETAEAAALLGASRWQAFRLVTLPQIVPGLVSSSLIVFAFNVGAFEAPFILGGGFPDTLPVVAWRLFQDADYARQLQGMATVVSIALVSGLLLAAYLIAYRRWERRIGRA